MFYISHAQPLPIEQHALKTICGSSHYPNHMPWTAFFHDYLDAYVATLNRGNSSWRTKDHS